MEGRGLALFGLKSQQLGFSVVLSQWHLAGSLRATTITQVIDFFEQGAWTLIGKASAFHSQALSSFLSKLGSLSRLGDGVFRRNPSFPPDKGGLRGVRKASAFYSQVLSLIQFTLRHLVSLPTRRSPLIRGVRGVSQGLALSHEQRQDLRQLCPPPTRRGLALSHEQRQDLRQLCPPPTRRGFWHKVTIESRKLRQQRPPLTQGRGFGLVEVLVSAGIGAILLYGVMQSSLVAFQSVQVTKTAQAEEYLKATVKNMLSDSSNCRGNLFVPKEYYSAPPSDRDRDYDIQPRGLLVHSDGRLRGFDRIRGEPDFIMSAHPDETEHYRYIYGSDRRILSGYNPNIPDIPILKIGSFADGFLDIKALAVRWIGGDPSGGQIAFYVLYTKPRLKGFETLGGEECKPTANPPKKKGCYWTEPIELEYNERSALEGPQNSDGVSEWNYSIWLCDNNDLGSSAPDINKLLKKLCEEGEVITFDSDGDIDCKPTPKLIDHDDDDNTAKQVACSSNQYLIGIKTDGSPDCAPVCAGGGGRFWNKELTTPACDCPEGTTWSETNFNCE